MIIAALQASTGFVDLPSPLDWAIIDFCINNATFTTKKTVAQNALHKPAG
jgi:hypothetical protein